jgi:hypothetical protein
MTIAVLHPMDVRRQRPPEPSAAAERLRARSVPSVQAMICAAEQMGQLQDWRIVPSAETAKATFKIRLKERARAAGLFLFEKARINHVNHLTDNAFSLLFN